MKSVLNKIHKNPVFLTISLALLIAISNISNISINNISDILVILTSVKDFPSSH
ncbi:MAG: hypothetical protein MJA82_00205 [Clostridia bacterium]|nr:hypothetical protein [Clostridia bacterium]